MTRYLVATAALAAALAGCKTEPPPATGTEDIRLDGAPEGIDPHSLTMCVNDAGEIFTVWIDDRDGTPDLWSNRSLDGGETWLPSPVKINRGEENNVFAPAIACTSDSVYVVWEDDRIGELENHQIFVSFSKDGGETWLEEDIVLTDDEEGLHMALGPQIVAMDAGEVYVTWYDSSNGAYDIHFSASVDGGVSWREPLRVDTDQPGSAYSAAPQIAATAQGEVFITWEDSRDGASDIYFARSDNSGVSFRSDVRLDLGDSPGAYNSFAPRIDVSDAGDVYVVWHDERNGVGRDIYYNYSGNFGVDWRAEATRLDSTNAGFFNSIFPEVLVDDGVAHVAWQDARTNEVYDIYYRRIEAGEPGEEEVQVDTGNGIGIFNAVNAQLALDAGQLIFGWEDYRNDEVSAEGDQGLVDLFYNYLQDGVPTESDYRIDSWYPGLTNKVDFQIDLHNGKVISAWIDDRELNYGVYFQAHELGEQANFITEEAE